MSKIILDGFKTDSTTEDIDAILTHNLFWYDKANNILKIGNRKLNYYLDNLVSPPVKVLTTMTQEEAPGLTILPVEFTVTT